VILSTLFVKYQLQTDTSKVSSVVVKQCQSWASVY